MESRDCLVLNPAFLYLYKCHLKSNLPQLISDIVDIIADYIMYQSPKPLVLMFDGKVTALFSSKTKAEGYLNRIHMVDRSYYEVYRKTAEMPNETIDQYFKSRLKSYRMYDVDFDLSETVYMLCDEQGYVRGYQHPDQWLTTSVQRMVVWRKDCGYNEKDQEWLKNYIPKIDPL